MHPVIFLVSDLSFLKIILKTYYKLIDLFLIKSKATENNRQHQTKKTATKTRNNSSQICKYHLIKTSLPMTTLKQKVQTATRTNISSKDIRGSVSKHT